MELMIQPLKKYLQFSGRASRKEYWLFILFIIVCSLVLSLLEGALGLFKVEDISVLSSIFLFATLIPSWMVGIRRLHDTDRNGWWMLLSIIPIGNLILLVFFCLKGTQGENRFGTDPIVNNN